MFSRRKLLKGILGTALLSFYGRKAVLISPSAISQGSNQLVDDITPIYLRALKELRRRTIMPRLVSGEFNSDSDTIDVPIPSTFK